MPMKAKKKRYCDSEVRSLALGVMTAIREE